MRILHLISNWKWTGPAEPAVRLAARLQLRHDVEFACGACPYPDLENQVASEAAATGLPVLDRFTLRKHFDPLNGVRDVALLVETMRKRPYRVVHAHLLNDHLLAGVAARKGGSEIIVRTVYGESDAKSSWRTRFAFRHLTDGVICASEGTADLVRRRFDIPDDRVFVVPGAVDVERFAPERIGPLRELARSELGFDDDDVVLGIVARVQRHRQFGTLLSAFAEAVRSSPRLRLVVVGRGTHIEEVAMQPARKLGIEGRIRFVGYRAGRDYDATLAALDVGIYLVPGSDGSCRAARELCAASLPLIVTPRSPLPEIVDDGVTGLVVEESVNGLAEGMVAIANDEARRHNMALASRERAFHFFSLEFQADEVEEIYCRLLDRGPIRSGV